MKCTNPKLKKLVSLYQFNLLEEQEKIAVEAHLLECEACFEELYVLGPIINMMEENPECFNEILTTKPGFIERMSLTIKRRWYAIEHRIRVLIQATSRAIVEWIRIPAVRILVPATVVAVVLLFVLLPSPKHYSDLAIINNASYAPLHFRGLVHGYSATDELLNHGIKLYEQRKYAEAVAKLLDYTRQRDDDPYGHFYTGLSLLHTNEFKNAVEHLKTAANLSQKQGKEILLEKCYWFLGNAFLKLNDVESSVQEFQKVIEINGQYATDAKQQIERIKAIRDK
ncbi:MAG: zf-HC2 domain-containing protein [candidate division KSB1 bacterium]|nr:zf-HC2 domain-containing protein [candidate division KSB1 bacterium]MDZ7318464.1 zf-HC2 domain-containing protein [candidate division KSB1 bacterium]MDZ7340086.1 zf-HC2 domain-containing protein [candidate division KSB1 bacterium]